MANKKSFVRVTDLMGLMQLANEQVERLEKRVPEEELSEIVSRLREYLDGIGQGVETLTGFWRDARHGFLISEGVRVLDCNPAMASFLGYEDEKDLLGVEDFPARHGADIKGREGLEEKRRKCEEGEECDVPFCTRDGHIVWGLSSGRLAVDGRYHGITVDITEKKKSERLLEGAMAQLKRLEMVDPLTRLPNRRFFDDHLNKEWRRAVRNGQDISLILCGIDFFKRYNDTYGHLAGDDCLRTIAGIVGGSVNRPCDLAARYGGEEFGVILTETVETEAVHIANNICKAVQSRKIPHARAVGSACISVSIGIASMKPAPGQEPEEIIARLDTALAQAKKTGRNRCVPG